MRISSTHPPVDQAGEPLREARSPGSSAAASMIMVGGLIALVIGVAVSVSFGAADISLPTVWAAIFQFDPEIARHQVIHELRLPRVLGSILVGAAFAVAGAIMQGMTRNPMADSGLLGLNAGASCVLALCLAFIPGLSLSQLILLSFIGAGLGALMVFGISSLGSGGASPVRLVLAGAGVSALLLAVSEGIALYFKIGQDLAYWRAGGVASIRWPQLKVLFPWVASALLLSGMLSRSVTMLSLGEEVAAGLGQRTRLVKAACIAVILVLAGASVSVVGAVGFVGLIIPHIVRACVGQDYRRIIPCSAVLGGLLMLLADLGARMVNPPYETPVGTIISLIGVPFFLYLTRKTGRSAQ